MLTRMTIAVLACVAFVSGLPSLSNAAGLPAGALLRSTLAPAPTNLEVFASSSACAQHLDAPSNCTDALAHGLLLFTFACAGCDKTWSALFVVNGQPSPQADISLAPSKLAALDVRANQFRSSDCVAIRIYNPANPTQMATSPTLCLSSVLARAHPPTLTSASVGTIITHPNLNGSMAHTAVLSPNYLFAPKALSITHDLPTCTTHGGLGGGLACMAGLQAGMLALIWACSSCDVDGYNLYRVAGGQRVHLPSNGAYGHDATVTLALFSPPSFSTGTCYAVTAFKGANESALSNPVCTGAGSTATTVTLSPVHALHWDHFRESRTGAFGYKNDPGDFYDQNLYVGYADHYGEQAAGDFYVDNFHRVGVAFDLSSMIGHQIYKATLKLSALASWHDFDNTDWETVLVDKRMTALSPEVCLTILDLATDRWWLNNDLNSSVGYLAPGGFMGPDFSMDVTSAVSQWTSQGASPNFGFIFRGSDENDLWHGPTNHVCLTQMQSVSLVVSYF